MRIAFISQEYPPETAKGGIGSQTYLKAHGLASLGHEIRVISRSPTAQKTEQADGPIRVIRVPGLDARTQVFTEITDWLTYSAEVAVAIADLHARNPLDLVEFPEWGCEAYVHLLNRTEWNFIPTAIQLHGPLVMFAHTMGWPDVTSDFYRVGTQMEATCLRLADAVFSSSACSADWCAERYGLTRGDIPILHTGVDTELFSPREQPKSKRPTIIFVGKLVRNKGVHLLVEAACRLVKEFPDLQLRLLGRGEPATARQLQESAQASGHDELLELVGFVPRTELPEHLSRAHIFAVPSQYEGGPGFVWLEAMASGLPVIACSGSGAAEGVQDGENGLLVPPQNVDALTQALRSLLCHAEYRQRLANAARQYVLEHADSRACLKRLEEFYGSVAAPKRSPNGK